MIQVVTSPTSEPLNAQYVKNYLHWDDFTDDMTTILEDYISAARELLEKHLNVSFVKKTYKMWLDRDQLIDSKVTLLYPPHTSVVSVKGMDSEGNLEELSKDEDYYVYEEFAYVLKMLSWYDKFVVQFKSGYGTLPTVLKMAIAEQVGNWYEGEVGLGELSAAVQQKVGAYSHNI
jgi:uncharacterized phiE125 gp8 family phage protein